MEADTSPAPVEPRDIRNRILPRREPSAFDFSRNRGERDESHVLPFRRQNAAANSTDILVEQLRLPQSGGDLSRLRDIVGSSILLAFLAPVLILASIAIKLTDGGPILFRQRRVGRFGKEFICYKFRTMLVDSEERLQKLLAENSVARQEWQRCHKLTEDPRITWLGAFLRFSSIDELPQLWNVLRGDMSLVGPRPIVAAELKRYGRYSKYYKQVLPGLTGLWQVNGRSRTTYRRRVALDVVYVKNKSLLLDFRILFATVPEVLLARGAC